MPPLLITAVVALGLVGLILLLGKLNAQHLSKDTGDRRLEGTRLVKPEAEELPAEQEVR